MQRLGKSFILALFLVLAHYPLMANPMVEEFVSHCPKLDIVNPGVVMIFTSMPGQDRTKIAQCLRRDLNGIYLNEKEVVELFKKYNKNPDQRFMMGLRAIHRFYGDVIRRLLTKNLHNKLFIIDGDLGYIIPVFRKHMQILGFQVFNVLITPQEEDVENFEHYRMNSKNQKQVFKEVRLSYERAQQFEHDFIFNPAEEHFESYYDDLMMTLETVYGLTKKTSEVLMPLEENLQDGNISDGNTR